MPAKWTDGSALDVQYSLSPVVKTLEKKSLDEGISRLKRSTLSTSIPTPIALGLGLAGIEKGFDRIYLALEVVSP